MSGATAEFHDGDAVRSVAVPSTAFVGVGLTPVAQQMLMMRYWAAHGKPAQLAILPDKPARVAVIQFAAHDVVNGVKLDRYTVSGLAFGSEVPVGTMNVVTALQTVGKRRLRHRKT